MLKTGSGLNYDRNERNVNQTIKKGAKNCRRTWPEVIEKRSITGREDYEEKKHKG